MQIATSRIATCKVRLNLPDKYWNPVCRCAIYANTCGCWQQRLALKICAIASQGTGPSQGSSSPYIKVEIVVICYLYLFSLWMVEGRKGSLLFFPPSNKNT